VAWIGTYSDFFARLTAFATIFVLPLGATVSAVMVADVSAALAVALPFLVGAVAVLSALLVWSLSERSGSWSDEDAEYKEPQRLSSSEEEDASVEPRSRN
jgi:membrane protein implicated in regulation of membrane protease activity